MLKYRYIVISRRGKWIIDEAELTSEKEYIFGETYPIDAFESMHYDFVCRCEGDAWPEE